MALFLPRGINRPAWDMCEGFLRKYNEKANAVFGAMCKTKFGFIIAHWQDETAEMPTHYLHRRKFAGNSVLAMRDFVEFGVEAEDPLRYGTLSASLRVVEVAQRKFPNLRFGLVFWAHPDAKFVLGKLHKEMLGEVAGSAKK